MQLWRNLQHSPPDSNETASEEVGTVQAELPGKTYEFIIDEKHRVRLGRVEEGRDGSFDHDNALTGDDLIEFVNRASFRICTASSGGPEQERA